MAEPLKNLLHPGVVTDIADRIASDTSAFDRENSCGSQATASRRWN